MNFEDAAKAIENVLTGVTVCRLDDVDEALTMGMLALRTLDELVEVSRKGQDDGYNCMTLEMLLAIIEMPRKRKEVAR